MSQETPKNLVAEIYIRPYKRFFLTVLTALVLGGLTVYDYKTNGFDIAYLILMILIVNGYKHQIKNFLLPPAHLKLYSNGIEIKNLGFFLTWDEIEVHVDKGLTILIDTDKVVYDLPAARKLGASKELIRGLNFIGYKFFFTRMFSNMSYHYFYKNVRRILLDRDMEISMDPNIAVNTTVEEAERLSAEKQKKNAPKKKKPAKKKPAKKKE